MVVKQSRDPLKLELSSVYCTESTCTHWLIFGTTAKIPVWCLRTLCLQAYWITVLFGLHLQFAAMWQSTSMNCCNASSFSSKASGWWLFTSRERTFFLLLISPFVDTDRVLVCRPLWREAWLSWAYMKLLNRVGKLVFKVWISLHFWEAFPD